MKKRWIEAIGFGIIAITLMVGFALGAMPRSATLATHAVGSLYNAMGTGIATVLSRHTPMTVRIQPFAGPPAWLPSMDKGETDMGMLTSADAITSYKGIILYKRTFKNTRILVVGGTLQLSFYVPKDSPLETVADLKGKRLGTARSGGSSHVSALIAMDHLGLDLKRDNITILQTGLDPERVAALEQKGLDAAMLQRLATKLMVGKGYTPLLDLNQAKIPYQNNALAAKKDFLTGRPQVGESFTRAVVEAFAYIFNKDNKQAVKEVVAKNLKLRSVDDAEDFYLEALEGLDRKPYPTLAGTRTVIKYVAEQNPKAASLKAEEIIDSSWLKNLENEGFFEKIYGGK